MRELLRNCCHIAMMPILRRKYLFLFACIVWVIFYIYVHNANSPTSSSRSDVQRAQEISLTTGSLSAKFPVDMDLMNAQEKGSKIIKSSNWDEIIKARLFQKINYEKHDLKRTPQDRMSKTNEKNPLEHNEAISKLKYASNQTLNAISVSHVNTNKPIKVDTSDHDLKSKFLIAGLKPTSFVIQPGYNRLSSKSSFSNETSQKSTPKDDKFIPEIRLVHFDLKGAPPKVSYFKSIFPVLKMAGANAILLEYEDMFPFWGPLLNASARNAYSKKDVMSILESAKHNGLEVIPLVQTFGHLEFVLKLQKFKPLREVEELPQALCPTNNGSLQMVKTMIDQVMTFHRHAKWLHIGSDEVYQLGQCKRCSSYDRNSLFLAYVKKVAEYVKKKYRVVPIMWDDMLRHISVPELQKYSLGSLVEPMVWCYVEDLYLFLPDSLWEKYSQVFPTVWAASAFKGAFGETLTVPDAKRHLNNNVMWLTVMKQQRNNFKGIRGIAITGWQRYDHFASLCELLPAGLPSLILSLITVSEGSFSIDVFPKMQDLLECSARIHYHLDLEHDPYLWRALSVCFFPGSPVFRLTLRHNDVTKSLDKFISDTTKHKGWLTEYNVRHNFSSPMRVNELLREFSYHNSSLQMLLDAAVKALSEVYDDYTVNEWIELNIYPFMKTMKQMWDDGMRLKNYDVWPRRPLPKAVRLPPRPPDFGVLKS